MDLETALSRPVPLDRCEEILRGVLLGRRAELRKSWRHFISSECLDALGSLAKEVESFLSGQNTLRDWRFAASFAWVNCDATFQDCLYAIPLPDKVEYPPPAPPAPPLSPFAIHKSSPTH